MLLASPILYLSDYIINNKADYYRLLQKARTADEWEEWILFILKAVEVTARQAIVQINEINELFIQAGNTIKTKAANLYNKEILELLFEQPYCRLNCW